MAAGLYDISPEDYKLSDSFGIIHSKAHFKKYALKDLLSNGSKLVEERKSKLETQIEEEYNKSDEEGQIFEQHDYNYGCEANNSLSEALLLAGASFLYSQFETLLIDIAKETQTLFNATTSVDTFLFNCKKKPIILCALNYIKKFSELDSSVLSSKWSNIEWFRRVRNCLVHSDGKLPLSSTNLIEYINGKADLEYSSQENKVVISGLMDKKNGRISFKAI